MIFNVCFTNFVENLKERNRSEGTIKEYSKDLKRLDSFLHQHFKGKQYDVAEVQTNDLVAYLDMLTAEKGYKPSSRNRQMNTLRSFFKYCKRSGLINSNPAENLERVKEGDKEVTFLKPQEVNQLLRAIDRPVIQLVVFTLFYTGLRISECLHLDVEDINFEEGKITVHKGKGGKKRVIPLHKTLKEPLLTYVHNWRSKGKSNRLFLTERTGGLSSVYVNKVIKEAVRTLGWKKKVTCHVLRHSFATTLVDNNVNLVAVKELLGHSNLKTTSSYAHLSQEGMGEALQSLSLD